MYSSQHEFELDMYVSALSRTNLEGFVELAHVTVVNLLTQTALHGEMSFEDFVYITMAEHRWKIADLEKMLSKAVDAKNELIAWKSDKGNADFPVDNILSMHEIRIKEITDSLDLIKARIVRYRSETDEDKAWAQERFDSRVARPSQYALEDCKKQLAVSARVVEYVNVQYPLSLKQAMGKINIPEMLSRIKQKIDLLENTK